MVPPAVNISLKSNGRLNFKKGLNKVPVFEKGIKIWAIKYIRRTTFFIFTTALDVRPCLWPAFSPQISADVLKVEFPLEDD